MKIVINRLGIMLCALGLLAGGCGKKESTAPGPEPGSWSLDKSADSGQLKQFIAAKEVQAQNLARQDGAATPPPEFQPFFAAAEKGDWQTATNLFKEMVSKVQKDSNARRMWWQPVMETYGVFELFPSGDEKYSLAFGRDIVASIPEGSIYFGGTDPGRFLVTAAMKSHADADPFFGLTQNALADGTYLDYLRSMYGEKIYIPSREDSQQCFQDYMDDAQKRLQNHQLKPGEDVHMDSSGHVQISGHLAVMQINALLAKTVFDKNTNREFYLEESFPLDWMYPNLEPHELIMKINRQPLTEISPDALQADHDYWTKYIAPMIGDWLTSETTVQELTEFAEKTCVKHDLNGFKGDPNFFQSADAQKEFSKLRSSIAGVYTWRLGAAQNGERAPAEYAPKNDAAKQQLQREADFAFKQAFALCPYSPEVVFRYTAFLMSQGRKSDALLLAQTATHVDPRNQTFTQLARSLSQ